MEKSGILSLLNINDKESEIFLEYLRKSGGTPAFDFINYLIGRDYIQLLDLIAGDNLKIPSRENLYRDLEYIKIYSYVKARGFTLDSMKCAAKIYNKKVSFARRAVIKISKAVDGKVPDCVNEKEIDKEEELNEYIAEDDGWGIVGYSFKCIYCGDFNSNRFVDEEDEKQECNNCHKINNMEPIV
jgi:hypothetical protein